MTLRLTYIHGSKRKVYRMSVADSTSITQKVKLLSHLQHLVDHGLPLPENVKVRTYYTGRTR